MSSVNSQKTADDKTEIFRSLPVPEALKKMLIPSVISMIIVLIYNMADTFYIGRTGNPYMVAGVSLILPVFNMMICITNLAGVGGGTLVSRLLGRSEEEEAKRVSWFSFWLGLVLALLFSLAIYGNTESLLLLLGAGDNTMLFAKQYSFCVLVLGAVPMVCSNVMANLVRSAGYSKEAGIGITGGGLLNVALDPLFMFVLLPQGMEVLGVGIATLTSNCISCLYFFYVLFRIRKVSVITLNPAYGAPEGINIKAIFGVGIPAAIATFMFDLDYVVLDKLMASYSDIALAAIGIVLKVERLPLNVGIGITQGMIPLIAFNYASGDHKRMDEIITACRKLGLIIAAVSIVLYEAFAHYIILFFINEPETAALATNFLRAEVLATPLMFLSFFTVHSFQGFGKGKTALFLAVARWGVFNIPILYIMNAVMGMYGLVWAQLLGDILNVILCYFVYTNARKNMRKTA